jgi:hypothetical protein
MCTAAVRKVNMDLDSLCMFNMSCNRMLKYRNEFRC